MAHVAAPPPAVESLISYCVEWLARNLRAKVTVTVWKSESDHYTEEYDARGLKVGAGDTPIDAPLTAAEEAEVEAAWQKHKSAIERPNVMCTPSGASTELYTTKK